MSKKPLSIKWLDKPEKHDYVAAGSYLSLLFDAATVTRLVKKLRRVRICEFAAKDLLRASNLSRLGISNSHVESDREKIVKGEGMSPVLLVRDSENSKLIVADGYHRLCAVYSLDEDATIPAKII
ncbi:hypothetical protein EC912_102169 [Luteibacter rhizovicinus]|uniref:ParB-like nuclease family protein n=1 Tax=Luteibacter rhizovicinus TaxID=242606 RepID=A0A4R3YWM1_9GAMM|nr:hypothetical protein [Luteibacter rhizovicinus]TCV95824.1 hypothetical protein EC912_102169 [Luteibacter rhizovicinus]